MAQGSVPHWHGVRADVHGEEGEGIEKKKNSNYWLNNNDATNGNNNDVRVDENDDNDDDRHGRKLQVFFNPIKIGVAASRLDAATFIKLLESKHENAGMKSPDEDILLLLLQSGAQFTSRQWLRIVTGALIVPPPIIGGVGVGTGTTIDDTNGGGDIGSSFGSSSSGGGGFLPTKLANAIAFNVEGHGKRTSFDITFTPIISEPSGTDINLSNGMSYPTPALNNNAGVAMRLDTYLNLPAQDTSLMDVYAANLDLALNLWLCADGIDMVKDLTLVTGEPMDRFPLSPEMVARFTASWMDIITANKFFHAYQHATTTSSSTTQHITRLEWETYMSKARMSQFFPKGVTQKCRSFSWYVTHINTDLTDAFQQAEEDIRRETIDLQNKAQQKAKEQDILEKKQMIINLQKQLRLVEQGN